MLPEIDIEGQEKINNMSLAFIGMGGLGCSASLYSALSGFGKIKIIDFDFVEASNLQRQILFDENDLSKNKASTSVKKLSQLNPFVELTGLEEKVDSANIENLLRDSEIILDCSDNFETRYLVNDICVEKQVPLVSGSCINQEGQIISFKNNDSGPCYECLFPRKKNLLDQNCESEGVIPTVAGSVGTFSSMQAISIILGDEECFNKLVLINMKTGKIAQSFLSENPGCIICS